MNPEQLAAAIAHRTSEVAGYQVNIDNYARIIENITEFWSKETEQYRGCDNQSLSKAPIDEDLLMRVGALLFKDSLICMLRAEKLEQQKAKLILQVLQDQAEGR